MNFTYMTANLPVGRSRCCDLTVLVQRATVNGQNRPSADLHGWQLSGKLIICMASCIGCTMAVGRALR